MKASIIAIGNSRGIRIPKPLLEESGLDGLHLVEMTVKKDGIKITAIKRRSRKKSKSYNDEYLMSLSSLSNWDTPEEDAAWAHLQ